MVSRRRFIGSVIGSASACCLGLTKSAAETPLSQRKKINRHSLVARHNPHLTKLDPLAPLSLGNGEFAFTADITGLQTFPDEYKGAMPLCTMSQWGWHTQPAPQSIRNKELKLIQYNTHGRSVGYHTSGEGQAELFNWLRENPHRLHLGRIGLHLTTSSNLQARATDISAINQQLDLWRGIITSGFNFDGIPVVVRTAVHPTLDLLAVSVESILIERGRLAVRLVFPYGSSDMTAADWTRPDKHQTRILHRSPNKTYIQRKLDDDEYYVTIESTQPISFLDENAHSFLLRSKTSSGRQLPLQFVIGFSQVETSEPLPTVSATFKASMTHWQRFWSGGGAVELADSRDPRALELERRVVLSQYLTAIQCAGTKPPQETGLTVNSWYGKFHLEMHWWHGTHFALWNRLPLFERSLSWYQSILPKARALAQSQGYRGARWPKMVGPEGRDSPSPIGPLLIWQQPHPIFYAEICYLIAPNRITLERYSQIVSESAEFMASFAFFDEAKNRYVLGPPVIPAQENHPPQETWNPTFELAYWRFGLKVAQRWRERLGLSRNPSWDQMIAKLSRLPVRDGVYLAHENCPQTYSEKNYDHPSMLGAFGFLPGDEVDVDTMRRTLYKTMREWQWEQTWGWDYPLTAMTAARLGETKIAVDALMMSTEKNRYLPNGHNWQRQNLPCYLPGNGGLLYAIAMMSAGWRGAPRVHAPGFPAEGSWRVRWENLKPAIT